METRTNPNDRRPLSVAGLTLVVAVAGLIAAGGPTATARSRGSVTYHLGFTRQPANAQVDESISSSAYNPAGDPIRVTVFDDLDHVASTFNGTITLSLSSNPGDGVLSGTLEEPIVGGNADFPDVSIDQSGFGYRLHAIACSGCGSFRRGGYPVAPADSHTFDIVDVVKTCDADPCSSGDVTDGNTTAHMQTSAGAPGDRLFFSVSPGALNCANYTETSSLVTFSVTGSRTKTVTVIVPGGSNRPLASYQVCYNSPHRFTARNGRRVNTGLLRDCAPATSTPAPCVVSRSLDGGDVIIVFSAPLGDPKGRV